MQKKKIKISDPVRVTDTVQYFLHMSEMLNKRQKDMQQRISDKEMTKKHGSYWTFKLS